MIYSGNAFADNADEEYQNKGRCPDCGGTLNLIDYCSRDKKKCEYECEVQHDDQPHCQHLVDGLECAKCGIVVEAE